VDVHDGLRTHSDGTTRCWWCGEDPLYVSYHDDEWGQPVHDDTRLFEKLCLEGFQSGLAWITILRKREGFRSAFAGFDLATLASWGDADIERLVQDAAIVRHRGKITSTLNNARRAIELIEREGSLDAFAWSYAPAAPRPRITSISQIPATSPESTALSKELKKRGWSFVGPTTVYAFMQSMGIVDDHIAGCFRSA
jgi:DNA-3-methyladenine glycosylase I